MTIKFCRYCHEPTENGIYCTWLHEQYDKEEIRQRKQEKARAKVINRIEGIKSHLIQGALCKSWRSAITN